MKLFQLVPEEWKGGTPISTPTEHQEQARLIKWAAYRSATLPELRMLVSIPNGGKRDPATGAKLKSEGLKAGFPDLALFVPRRGYNGLFIEMKRRPGLMRQYLLLRAI